MATHVHERRHITFQEYGALLAVREMLRRGDLLVSAKHDVVRVPKRKLDMAEPECADVACAKEGCHVFDMHTSGKKYGCGTVGCIGGMMGFIMGVRSDTYVNSSATPELDDGPRPGEASHSLYPLFYPPRTSDTYPWAWITPKSAVKAIDNFLETGKPSWKAVRAATTKGKKRKAS